MDIAKRKTIYIRLNKIPIDTVYALTTYTSPNESYMSLSQVDPVVRCMMLVLNMYGLNYLEA